MIPKWSGEGVRNVFMENWEVNGKGMGVRLPERVRGRGGDDGEKFGSESRKERRLK